MLFSIKIKSQQKIGHYIGILIPVAIQTLCMFFFAACDSLCLKRYLFIPTHLVAAKIPWKTLFVSTLQCPNELLPLRACSKNHLLTLTQLRAYLYLYVVSAVVDQLFTIIYLTLTILYRLTAAGDASAEEELLTKHKSKSALAGSDQIFCQKLQR